MLIDNFTSIAYPLAVFSVFISLAGFYLYYYPSHGKWVDRIGKKSTTLGQALLQQFLIRKTWGFVSMGVLPAVASLLVFNKPPSAWGLTVDHAVKYLPWLLLAIAIPAALNAFLARNSKNHGIYPQLRIKSWTPGFFMLNALGWFLYLLGYEFLFRGILLFGVYDSWGFWGAIATNTVIYSLAHFNKNMGEALGAIPFGIVICVITLSTGTIWFAIVAHVSLALSNDYFSIRHNPEMRFTKR